MPELRQHERLQLSGRNAAAESGPGVVRGFGRGGRVSRSKSQARAHPDARAWLFPFLLLLLVGSGTGCITIDVFGGGEEAALVESVVRGREGPKILLLDIDGVIGETESPSAFFGGPEIGTVARVVEMLDRARADDEISAVLLRIDSPGGTATASEQVYEEIVRFKTEQRIPVAAQLMGTATSGAYYVAMAADSIQAHPTTVTGSIGVIFTSLSFAGLMEKLGVEDQTLTGGAFKDAGSPFRRLSSEERAQLQTIVDDLHARFREIVGRGRPKLSPDQIAQLASGRVFSARQALELGLVDRIGSLEEMVQEVERRIGAPRSRVVAYHRPREIRRNLYTRSAAGPIGLDGGWVGRASPAERALLQQGLEQLLARSAFAYVWAPGIRGPGLGLSGVGWMGIGEAGLVGAGGSFESGPNRTMRTGAFDREQTVYSPASPAASEAFESSLPSDAPFTNIAD